MMQSTTIIAFDQHAATTVAAVLAAGPADAGAPHAGVGYVRRFCGSSRGCSARAPVRVLLRSRARAASSCSAP